MNYEIIGVPDCPKCGGRPILKEAIGWAFIACEDCGLKGPKAFMEGRNNPEHFRGILKSEWVKFVEKQKRGIVADRPKQEVKKRLCPVCKNSFYPKHDGHKFCSAECREKGDRRNKKKAYWSNIETRSCKECGEEFEVVKTTNKTFCKVKCREQYHKNKLKKAREKTREFDKKHRHIVPDYDDDEIASEFVQSDSQKKINKKLGSKRAGRKRRKNMTESEMIEEFLQRKETVNVGS